MACPSTVQQLVLDLRKTVLIVVTAATSAAGSACQTRGTDPAASRVSPVYNQDTGKLEQLVSDRDGDGRAETRAFMEGAILRRIEIDRNGDGAVDRWEFYLGASAAPGAAIPPPVIERAEEANGPDAKVTRREFFARGTVERVEDDTNLDGRTDKWEFYEAGRLARVELDLVGKGAPSQRLIYGAGGEVVRVETDPDGDGRFVVLPVKDSVH